MGAHEQCALALQSIIAVAQNDKVKALDLAGRAVETNPQSSSARVALSYALQANFDLQGALNSLKESVNWNPKMDWPGQGWLNSGSLSETLRRPLKAAERATTLNPTLSRTQTVLGFAYLDPNQN